MTKMAIGAGAVVALALTIFGWGYFRTAANSLKDAAHDAIPTETKLRRAEDMLKNDLGPKIQKLKRTVAEAETAVEHAMEAKDETIAKITEKRSQMQARLEQLNKDPNQETFEIKNVSYSRDKLKADLGNRLAGVKTLDVKLASQMKTLAARTKAFEANDDRLAVYLKFEVSLKAKIDQLSASLEAVEAQEDVAAHVDSDDSELKDLQDLLGKIDDDVSVRTKMVDNASGDNSNEIPVDNGADSDSVNAVEAYLNSGGKSAPVVDNTTGEIPVE